MFFSLRRRLVFGEISTGGSKNPHRRSGAVGTREGNGFLQVQINIPPEKSQKMDAVVVTCAYHPHEERDYGWQPPSEVMQIKNEAIRPVGQPRKVSESGISMNDWITKSLSRLLLRRPWRLPRRKAFRGALEP